MDKEQIQTPLFPEISLEIFEMAKKDQDMRNRSRKNNWIIETEEDNQVDFINTNRMKAIVEEIGWPTISKVGLEGSKKAWLLVQHADHDVGFQNQCLELMKKENQSEVLPVNVAYLEDRVRVNLNQPQIYGTQFYTHENIYQPRPIEDPENINKRRASVGLGTLEEYTKELKEVYKIQ